MQAWVFSFSILVCTLIPKLAFAHPQDMGLLEAQSEKDLVHIRLEMLEDSVTYITSIDKDSLSISGTPQQAKEILAATLAAAPITTPAGECNWGEAYASRIENKVRLLVTAKCPGDASAWKLDLPFLENAPHGYELLIKLEGGPTPQEFIATPFSRMIDYSPQVNHSWGEFIAMGTQHIGATPSEWIGEKGFQLPDGIDHILFVLALVIGGGGFYSIIKTVTGFTLGHSITLALATSGVIHIPSRIVESTIALSIAFVAAESLFLKNARNRWKLAMGFGLVHGLGFASALGELHLNQSSLLRALVGFNLGVEVGQAIIVAIALPVVMGLQRNQSTRPYAIPTAASMIFLAGSYWFVRRAFAI